MVSKIPLVCALLALCAGALASVLSARRSPSANVAFHIRWGSNNALEATQFLARIYHAHNVYLFDVDERVNIASLHRAFRKYRNVHVRSVDRVVPNGISEALSILDGISFFLDSEDVKKKRASASTRVRLFDFFVSLTDANFPLLDPVEIRHVLGSSLLHTLAPTFMRFSHPSHWPHFTQDYNMLHYDASLVFSRNASALNALIPGNFAYPDRVYRTQQIARMEKDMVLSYDFAKFSVDSMLSKRVLIMFAESVNVVEHFFGTLAIAAVNVSLLVRSTSLRCPDTIGLDTPLTPGLSLHYSRPAFSVADSLKSATPCLFASLDRKHASAKEINEVKEFLKNRTIGLKSPLSHVSQATEKLHLHLSLALKEPYYNSRPARALQQPL